MDGWDIRRRRREAGLTLVQVARVIGTSESNLSAYERSAKRPNHQTVTRIDAALTAGADSPIYRMNLLTVPAAAAAIRRGLKEGWTTADLLRCVAEMRSNARFVAGTVDLAAYFAEPTTTGDARWDAMLAGVVEDLAITANAVPPRWTAATALPRFWFVGSLDGLAAYSFSHTPMSLQVRGVMVDPDDLVSV